MKISIVTISFNQGRFLRECIESVLGQSHADVEHIVVDPGSTDGSRDIAAAYGSRITQCFQPDHGPADGLNKGFALATGEIFGFLNADDVLLPGALDSVASAFSSGQYDVISGGGYMSNEIGVPLRRVVPSRFTPWLYVNGAVSIFQQGTFFKGELFRGVGGFNKENKTCWDGELFLDMSLAGAKFHVIPGQLAKFRLHGESITGSGRLNDAYALESDRLFERVMSRPRTSRDRVIGSLARIMKFVADPGYLWRRGFSTEMPLGQ